MMMAAVALICMTMMSVSLTSCGGDDDKTDPIVVNKPVAGVLDCSLTVGDDLLDKFNLSVEYYDENGKVQTEALTKVKWEKRVMNPSLPATLGFRLLVKAKDGIDYSTLEKVTQSYTYAFEAYSVNVKGDAMEGGRGGSSHSSLDIPGKKVTEWLADKTSGIVKVAYIINESGKAESTSW